jgi:hypothetical protein
LSLILATVFDIKLGQKTFNEIFNDFFNNCEQSSWTEQRAIEAIRERRRHCQRTVKTNQGGSNENQPL